MGAHGREAEGAVNAGGRQGGVVGCADSGSVLLQERGAPDVRRVLSGGGGRDLPRNEAVQRWVEERRAAAADRPVVTDEDMLERLHADDWRGVQRRQGEEDSEVLSAVLRGLESGSGAVGVGQQAAVFRRRCVGLQVERVDAGHPLGVRQLHQLDQLVEVRPLHDHIELDDGSQSIVPGGDGGSNPLQEGALRDPSQGL